MGYTHYFKFRNNTLTKKALDGLKEDLTKITQQIKLKDIRNFGAGGFHSDEPIVIGDTFGEKKGADVLLRSIALNGMGGLGHETFALTLGKQNDWFCKTARKPYDLVVCLLLLSCKYHQTGTNVSSDGDMEDWAFAITQWYEMFPSRKVVFTFAGDEIVMTGIK